MLRLWKYFVYEIYYLVLEVYYLVLEVYYYLLSNSKLYGECAYCVPSHLAVCSDVLTNVQSAFAKHGATRIPTINIGFR